MNWPTAVAIASVCALPLGGVWAMLWAAVKLGKGSDDDGNNEQAMVGPGA